MQTRDRAAEPKRYVSCPRCGLRRQRGGPNGDGSALCGSCKAVEPDWPDVGMRGDGVDEVREC